MQLKHHPTQTQPPRFPGAFPGSIKARPSRAFPGHFSPVLLPHDLGKSGFHRSSRNPDFIPSSLLGCATLPAGAAPKESGEGIPRGSWRQEWDLWGLFLRFPVGFGSIKGWIPAGIGCEVGRAEAAPRKEAEKKKICCCFYGILNKGIFFFPRPQHGAEGISDGKIRPLQPSLHLPKPPIPKNSRLKPPKNEWEVEIIPAIKRVLS